MSSPNLLLVNWPKIGGGGGGECNFSVMVPFSVSPPWKCLVFQNLTNFQSH